MKPTHEQIETAKQVLSDAGFIQVYWTEEDIRTRQDEDEPLTDEQVKNIRENIERRHDANIGINWEVIDIYIHDELHPVEWNFKEVASHTPIDQTKTYWAIATETISSPEFAWSDENENPILFATKEEAEKELKEDEHNEDEFVTEVKIEDGFLKSINDRCDWRKIANLDLLKVN